MTPSSSIPSPIDIKGIAATLPPLQDMGDDMLSSTVSSVHASGSRKGEEPMRGKRRRESLHHGLDSDVSYKPPVKKGKSSRHGERSLAVHTKNLSLEAVDDDFVSLKSGYVFEEHFCSHYLHNEGKMGEEEKEGDVCCVRERHIYL